MSGLRWFGGKWALSKSIVALMPPHDIYVEPFAGGMSVLCSKPRVSGHGKETVNDINHRLVGAFQVMRDRPDDLVRAMRLTPWSREEFGRCCVPHEDPVEDARRLIAVCYLGRAKGGTENPGGFRSRATRGGEPAMWSIVESVAARLRGVQVECLDGIEIIRRYGNPAALVYVDPPYSSRERGSTVYANEPAPGWHIRLVDELIKSESMMMVSGYRGGEYDRLTDAGWRSDQFATKTQNGAQRTEVLWRNDKCVEASALPLFGGVNAT